MAQPPPNVTDSSSVPRHLQPSASSSSSHQSSPVSTPPPPRSPGLNAGPLPSPSFPPNAPLPSPSGTTNRFGLALGNLIQRRPRGNTNPSSMTGSRSPGQGAGSPSSELPPSPGGGERGGYGFPALRRTLSKRAGSQGGNGTISPNGTRGRRSSSQPPQPVGMQVEGSGDSSVGGRPRTATADTVTGAGGGLGLDVPVVQAPTVEQPPTPAGDAPQTFRLRLVPHLESSRSLHFEPVDRSITAFQVLKVGRFTDRSHSHAAANGQDSTRIAFKSKVVSRGHAEIWADAQGKFHIRDTKSSSGTFLNHIRLSGPNSESRAFPVKDGDVLQLGVDYQGGTEEIYRCVKMRVELNRGWQRGNNAFNTAALAQLRALGGARTAVDDARSTSAAGAAIASSSVAAAGSSKATTTAAPKKPQSGPVASVTDCCICLYPVTVCQALFIAPCSHVTHFKCIRPLIMQNYPGFCCPLCRTYADMEAEVEIDEPWEESSAPAASTDEIAVPATVAEEPQAEAALDVDPLETPDQDGEDDAMSSVEEASEPPSRAASLRSSAPILPQLSGLARSRPASLRDEPPASPSSAHPHSHSPTTPRAPSNFPLASSIPGSRAAALTEAEIFASLASAATPPNSTFLSTLADGRLPLPHSSHRDQRTEGAPVSLHSALAGAEAGPSGGRSEGSEDEADGARDEEGEVSVATGGKGKGRAVDPDEDTMDHDGRAHEGKASLVSRAHDRDVQMDEGEVA